MTAASVLESPPLLALVDPDRPDAGLSVEELGSGIVGLAGRIAAATSRWLLLVADFDQREGCARFGLPSTARWLGHHCGLAHRTAVEHVRVARALAKFPRLAEEMSAGRLSYSQVRAISRVPEDGEHRTVADLIEVAEHGTTAQLETVVRGMRTVEQNEAGQPPPEEYLRHDWSSGGQWRMNARLAPERGALVQSAVEQLARAEQLTHAEALVRMAELTLAILNDRADQPRPLRGDERAAVVIEVDATTDASLPRPAEHGRPEARIRNGPGLPKSVAERLLCSARIRTATRNHTGEVLDLGRSQRVVSKAQFRALLMRDKHCRYPGCGSRSGLEAHHVRHWIDGGRTDMRNLILLCARHHHLHHDGFFSIVARGRSKFGFVRADGRELAAVVDPRPVTAAHPPVERIVRTADDAPRTRWGGERLDRRWAISVLATRRANARSRPGP
jgi:Domain of unknown function (DUF222)/HNH endonuclease